MVPDLVQIKYQQVCESTRLHYATIPVVHPLSGHLSHLMDGFLQSQDMGLPNIVSQNMAERTVDPRVGRVRNIIQRVGYYHGVGEFGDPDNILRADIQSYHADTAILRCQQLRDEGILILVTCQFCALVNRLTQEPLVLWPLYAADHSMTPAKLRGNQLILGAGILIAIPQTVNGLRLCKPG